MKHLAITLINFYQKYLSFDRGMLAFLAPGGACKFNPSCSEYTKQMILKHGTLQGSVLGLKRIWSCR